DQKAIIATAQGKFDAGKEAWEEAKESYLGAVSGVNTAVDGLRAQLSVWQTGVDLINAAGSTVTDITENQKTAIFSAIKTYYVTRYNFDRKTSVVANIPTTWAGLNDVAVFSRDIFFSSVAVVDYQTYINNLKTDSDIKIRNNYEWRNYEDNADVTSGNAIILVGFPASTSTVPEAYVNSTIGKYLYLSRNVYGASALADVHYYLPYNVRPLPTEQAPNVPSYPDINNYNSSLFKILADAKNVLAELEANAANTFYVENYKSVLGVVNRTIAYYEGLKTEYEAKVVEINAEIEAQQAVVDAKKAAKDAAQLASNKATVDYDAANTYAGTLGYIYDQLKDVTGTTLYIIKEAIATQETKINALVTALKNAENALREYRASGDAGDLIAKLVAEKEAKIAAIDAEIAILEIAIAEIEAKMEELLKDDE
ncbi:MAG: hypothetical protein LBD91_00610, partial [Prevotellaceae bacterium]|nr:hypothetical protein [Prevotellaceae bacterium]